MTVQDMINELSNKLPDDFSFLVLAYYEFDQVAFIDLRHRNDLFRFFNIIIKPDNQNKLVILGRFRFDINNYAVINNYSEWIEYPSIDAAIDAAVMYRKII